MLLLAGLPWIYAGTTGPLATAAAPLSCWATTALPAARYSISYPAATDYTTPGEQQAVPQVTTGSSQGGSPIAHCPLFQIPKAQTQPSLASLAGYHFNRSCAQATATLTPTACIITLQQQLHSSDPSPMQPQSSLLLSPNTSSSTLPRAFEQTTGSHGVHMLPAVAAVLTVCRTGTCTTATGRQQQERLGSSR